MHTATMTTDPLTLDGAPDALMLDGGTADSLTVDGEQSFPNSDPLTVDGGQPNNLSVTRSHGMAGIDPLTVHGEDARVAGVDWDKPRSCRVSLPGQDIFNLSPDEFIDWYRAGADGADVVCFERPHLRARGQFSRAQIWTADDLEKLVGGPAILMPNGKKLHKMARHAKNLVEVKRGNEITLVPDKTRDAESIRLYAEAHPDIMRGWKRFVPPSKDVSVLTHAHRDELREQIGKTINEWRELWQDVTGKEAIRSLEFVRPAAAILDAEFDNLSADCKAVFKLTKFRGTVNLSAGKTRIMTVYAMAYDADGNLRTYKNRPLGRTYLIKDVVGLCDSYMPNMARANLAGYGKTGQAGADNRNKLNRAVKELLRVFQDAGTS